MSITSANLNQCSFVCVSDILHDVTVDFGVDRWALDDEFFGNVPWTWGDTNRVMVGNEEFVDHLATSLFNLDLDEIEVDTYCNSLRDFLTTQGAYVDVSN